MYMAPLSVKEELMKQMLRMDYEPEQVVDISTSPESNGSHSAVWGSEAVM